MGIETELGLSLAPELAVRLVKHPLLTAEALPDQHGEAIRCWLKGQSERLLPELDAVVGVFREQAVPWKIQ